MIVEKASDVYLLADGSKFNKSTLLTYAPLEKVDTIITTPNIPAEYQIFCQEQGLTFDDHITVKEEEDYAITKV